MKFSIGNEKLGDNCLVVSRAVGDTCPSSCHFLNNGCYAQLTEKRFPNARNAGVMNAITDWQKIRSLIKTAINKSKSVRIHERGDWGNFDQLDLDYIQSWKRGIESVLSDNEKLPYIWCYTHFYDHILIDELGKYMTIYASIHNIKQFRLAKKEGFTRFAWCDTDDKFVRRGKKGNKNAPKFVKINKVKYFTCPEMRIGRDTGGVTCTGNKKTKSCNLCTKSLGNVLFLKH